MTLKRERARCRPAATKISIRTRSASAARGELQLGGFRYPCSLGRGGIAVRKHEGDGASPQGCWRVQRVLYRADRLRRPRTRVPLKSLRPSDGWCDAVGDRNYNRPVRHPYAGSAERLWREDARYDVIVVLSYNVRPRIQGRGSAIFMHVAGDGFAPTAGCIALRRADLLHVIERIAPGIAINLRVPAKKRPE